MGVIRESSSQFVSPAFPIFKKNGNVRIVVDYRHLNSLTTPLKYPHPPITEFLQQLENSKIFSIIDLNSGFYQIPIKPSSIKYSAFILNNRV